jgi:hypothetical protein
VFTIKSFMRVKGIMTITVPVISMMSWMPLANAQIEATALRPLGPEPHPYTTEPGRTMVEFVPLIYTHDQRNPERENRRVDAFNVRMLLKYGALDDLDLQIGADLFAWEREDTRDTGERDTRQGFGDLTLRAKYNLWGNDGGETAVSVMPFMILPTSTCGTSDPGVRGGLMIPTAWEPAGGWVIEWTPTFAAVRNSPAGYAFEFASLLVLNHEIIDSMSAFVEFGSSITSARGDPWVGVVGPGLTIAVDENTVIEPAVHLGVTRSAEDAVFSLTFVKRF